MIKYWDLVLDVGPLPSPSQCNLIPQTHCLHAVAPRYWVQPTVTFPIGDHVNVCHEYKKTGPSTILKLTCHCHNLIDMLVEFSQSIILLTHLKCLNVPYASIFTNFCMNYYAHMPCGEKIAKNPSPIEII